MPGKSKRKQMRYASSKQNKTAAAAGRCNHRLQPQRALQQSPRNPKLLR